MYRRLKSFAAIGVLLPSLFLSPTLALADHTPEHTLEQAEQQVIDIQAGLFDRLLNTVAVLQAEVSRSLNTEAGRNQLALLGQLQDEISELRALVQNQLNTDF